MIQYQKSTNAMHTDQEFKITEVIPVLHSAAINTLWTASMQGKLKLNLDASFIQEISLSMMGGITRDVPVRFCDLPHVFLKGRQRSSSLGQGPLSIEASLYPGQVHRAAYPLQPIRAQVLQPEPISMTIILDEDDSPPTSEAPIDLAILKRSKLSAANRAEVGWESPEDWEFDNETLAAKITKLKKKQDGEVDNPPSTPSNMDLPKEVAAAAQVSKAKRSMAVVSPVSGTRTSARSKGSEGQPILQKAVKRAAAKAGMSPPSTPPNVQFIDFSSTSDLVFMGIAEDCGIMLRDSRCSPADLISLVRAKEIAQAKLAEAIEREAAKVVATEVEPPSAQSQRDPTSVVGAPPHAPQTESLGGESTIADICVAPSGSTRRKRKLSTPSVPLRPNLRPTPARQARALQMKS
jgi:hypothetical protein